MRETQSTVWLCARPAARARLSGFTTWSLHWRHCSSLPGCPSSDHKPHSSKRDGTGGLHLGSHPKVIVEIRRSLLDVPGRLVIQAHNLTETFGGQLCLEFRICQISERCYGAHTMTPTEGPRQHPIINYINISTVKHEHAYSY